MPYPLEQLREGWHAETRVEPEPNQAPLPACAAWAMAVTAADPGSCDVPQRRLGSVRLGTKRAWGDRTPSFPEPTGPGADQAVELASLGGAGTTCSLFSRPKRGFEHSRITSTAPRCQDPDRGHIFVPARRGNQCALFEPPGAPGPAVPHTGRPRVGARLRPTPKPPLNLGRFIRPSASSVGVGAHQPGHESQSEEQRKEQTVGVLSCRGERAPGLLGPRLGNRWWRSVPSGHGASGASDPSTRVTTVMSSSPRP